MHRARRICCPRKTEKMKKEEARWKVMTMLGEDRVRKLQQKWRSLDTHRHTFDGDGDNGNGILICLQNFGLSCIQIRATLGCSTSRLTKLNQSQKADHTPASHALTATPVGIWHEFIDSFDVGDGFPCAHCRPKFYFLQENPKERIT